MCMSHSLCVMGVDNEVKMTVPVVVRYVHSDKKEKRNRMTCMDPTKIAGIKNWPIPTKVKDI
jgi:hypothetical protein